MLNVSKHYLINFFINFLITLEWNMIPVRLDNAKIISYIVWMLRKINMKRGEKVARLRDSVPTNILKIVYAKCAQNIVVVKNKEKTCR